MANAAKFRLTVNNATPFRAIQSSEAGTDISLNSAYIYDSGGAAYSCPLHPRDNATLTHFWVVVRSVQGTWGSTDGSLNWEVRGPGIVSGSTDKPTSTLVASGTFALSGSEADTWVKVSGLSVSLTGGQPYYLVIADADGSAGNYAVMSQRSTARSFGEVIPIQAPSTANGWSTVTTGTYTPRVAVKLDGVVYAGQIFNGLVSGSTDTLMRGNRMVVAQDVPPFSAAAILRTETNFLGEIRVYEGASAIPSNTPTHTLTPYSISSGTVTRSAVYWPVATAPVFLPGRTYWVVFKPSTSNNGVSQRWSTFAGVDDDLRTAFSGIEGIKWTACKEVSGGASWTLYDDQITTPILCNFAPVATTTASVACG
jgi:hypothetical protein